MRKSHARSKVGRPLTVFERRLLTHVPFTATRTATELARAVYPASRFSGRSVGAVGRTLHRLESRGYVVGIRAGWYRAVLRRAVL
jgi:hypothetical protein